MCVLSHIYVLPNVELIFGAKSYILGYLSLLTNFQKFVAVTITVSIVGNICIKRCYACSTVIKITYCRCGYLIWLEGHFEKAVFSCQIARFIWQYWVHCVRCRPTIQTTNVVAPKKTSRLYSQVLKRRLGSRTF